MWDKLKSFTTGIWSDLVDTYKRIKILLLAILAAVVYFEWTRIKAIWLVKSGQTELNSDNKQDAQLKTKEDSDKEQADALVQKAKDEPNPGDDWYKK